MKRIVLAVAVFGTLAGSAFASERAGSGLIKPDPKAIVRATAADLDDPIKAATSHVGDLKPLGAVERRSPGGIILPRASLLKFRLPAAASSGNGKT